jgi:hypothetical protein
LKDKLNKIRHGIESLTSFVERAEKLHDEPSRERHKVKFMAPLESIRENACKVHRTLLSQWCIAHTSHRAAILLEDRLQRHGRRKQTSQHILPYQCGAVDCFTLCLNEHVSAPKWLSAEFRLLEIHSR